MHLLELDPFFVNLLEEDGHQLLAHRSSLDGAQGVLFDDPRGSGCRILVWFANPRGVPVCPAYVPPTPRWAMSGTGFNDLTLSPSVDAHGVWHGFVQGGEITTVG